MTKRLTIALDGPAGSGKSTLARKLAARLGYRYLDTGAMYRTVALLADRRGIAAEEGERLAELLREIEGTLRLVPDADGPRVRVGDEDVTAEIRTPEVSRIVSEYASVPAVRRAMRGLQRAQREGGGLVAEGRDIGTVVFPDADLKFYVDASPEERARRRLGDFGVDAADADKLAEVRADIERRDSVDTGREDSPLVRAEGAETIDTTGLTVEQVLERMLRRVAEVAGCSTGS
jgi:cytidylate kinase